MIGWDSVLSRDYDEAVVNGRVDSDLERMKATIETRIKERDGVKRCPVCGELLEDLHRHEAEGMMVGPLNDRWGLDVRP